MAFIFKTTLWFYHHLQVNSFWIVLTFIAQEIILNLIILEDIDYRVSLKSYQYLKRSALCLCLCFSDEGRQFSVGTKMSDVTMAIFTPHLTHINQQCTAGLFLFCSMLRVFRKSFLPNVCSVVCMEVILLIQQQNITPIFLNTQGGAQTQPMEPILVSVILPYTVTRALIGINTVSWFSLWRPGSPVRTCTWHSGHKKHETVSTLLLSALWKLNACYIVKNNLPLYALALFTLALLKNIGHTLKKDHAPWLCLLWELQTRLSQTAEHMHMGIPVWDTGCTVQWTEWTTAASSLLARITVCDFCHLQGLVKALIHAWTTQAIWGRQLC